MTDLTTLNSRVAAFRARDVITDDTSVFEVVATGLQVRLSEVLAGAPPGGRRSITVYADTLIVDMLRLDVDGAVICARTLDLSGLTGGKLGMRLPSRDTSVIEIVAQESTSPLLVQPDGGGGAWTPPLGLNPLQAAFFMLDSKGNGKASVASDPASLSDVLSRSWSLNSLRASAAAATFLSTSTNPSDVAAARSMLGWVVACITALTKSAPLPSDFAELYYQSAGLLTTLTVASGALFVPVLSSAFYKKQINTLVTAVGAYEQRIAELDASTDLLKTLAKFGAAFEGAAQDEAAPLRTQLDTITQNIKALNDMLETLQLQFISQQSDCATRLALMQAKIKLMQGAQFLLASLKGIVEYYMIGVNIALIFVDPAAGAGAAKEAITSALEIGKTAIEQIEKNGRDIADTAASPGGSRDLLNSSEQMITAQLQMVGAVQAGQILWASGLAGETGNDLPPAMASVSIDPALAWNSWMAVVESQMASVIAGITGDFSDDAKEAANDYLASLRILSEYGKAIGARTVALAGQLAEGSLVRARITAVMNTAARWKQLEAQARNDEERKAVMRGLLQSRADALKQSVFLAWTYYRASYTYLYFTPPPVTVTVDMTAAQLTGQVAAMSQWIGRLLGDSPDGNQVKLPAQDVAITLSFDIVPPGLPNRGSTDQALLVKGAGGRWRLTWAVPIGTKQLQGVLPNGGNVAIWIREAVFVVKGMQPNDHGNVIASVGISGTYQNGFAPDAIYRFVSKGLTGDYGYTVATNKPYIPWRIDPQVYTTPTPFTQWTMIVDPDGGDPSDAQVLELHLTIAYATKS